MTDESDDDLFMTPPSSPVIQPFEGNESLDLAQWKLDILYRAYEKVEARKKELELEEKRTLALLSKVSLKLKKSSGSSNNYQANQSLLGVKTKPTISKKTPVVNATPAAAGLARSTSEEQRRNTTQLSSANQSNGSLLVSLSPVLVRRLPPYDHNHLARRVECSEQADDLYRQLEHHLDTQNDTTDQHQQQVNSTTTGHLPSPGAIASGLPAGASPSAPHPSVAWPSTIIPPFTPYPIVTGPSPHSRPLVPRPAPYHPYVFQNQLPTIPPNNWPHQAGYMSDQPHSNYPYNPNNTHPYATPGPHQPNGSNTTYYGQNHHSTGNPRPGWNHQHFSPYSTTNNTYSPSPPPKSLGPIHVTPFAQNPAPVGGDLSNMKNQQSNQQSAGDPLSVNKQPDNPIPKPQSSNTPSSTKPKSSPSYPPPPSTRGNDEKKRKDSHRRVVASIPITVKSSKPPMQSTSKNTTSSSATDTSKKQIYQSPLATLGIQPEQSTKATRQSKRLDNPLCVFEAEGGTCNDDTCRSMHFRDF